MKPSNEFIEFLKLSPYDKVSYLLYCLGCEARSFIYFLGFWLSVFLSWVKLEKTSFYVTVYSGVLNRLLEKELITVEDLDKVLIESDYPSEWLGYGERLSSPWRHTFTRLAMLFRAK